MRSSRRVTYSQDDSFGQKTWDGYAIPPHSHFTYKDWARRRTPSWERTDPSDAGFRGERWDPRRAATVVDAPTPTLPLWHASASPPERFMSAPSIHVGSKQVADFVVADRTGLYKDDETPATVLSHQFQVSPHSVVHERVFTDDEANWAHARHMERHGHEQIYTSHLPKGPWGGHELEALEALSSNRVIMYRNEAEFDERGNVPHHHGAGWRDQDRKPTSEISMVVPSPKLNLMRPGSKPPTEQPVLPMDWAGT